MNTNTNTNARTNPFDTKLPWNDIERAAITRAVTEWDGEGAAIRDTQNDWVEITAEETAELITETLDDCQRLLQNPVIRKAFQTMISERLSDGMAAAALVEPRLFPLQGQPRQRPTFAPTHKHTGTGEPLQLTAFGDLVNGVWAMDEDGIPFRVPVSSLQLLSGHDKILAARMPKRPLDIRSAGEFENGADYDNDEVGNPTGIGGQISDPRVSIQPRISRLE